MQRVFVIVFEPEIWRKRWIVGRNLRRDGRMMSRMSNATVVGV